MSYCVTLSRVVALAILVTLVAWTVQAADLIQTAERVGRFSSFLTMLEATGMADMLKRDGPFTVFAPTDEAFAQMPPGTLDRLLAGTSCSGRRSSLTSYQMQLSPGELLGQAVEVATLGGGTLAIDGTTGIIFLFRSKFLSRKSSGQRSGSKTAERPLSS